MTRKKTDPPAPYEFFLWEVQETADPEARLQAAAEAVCRSHPATRRTRWSVSFYPYTSLKSTIRIQNNRTIIRISDILREAPQDVLEALIHILAARLEKRKPDPAHLQRYREYAESPDVEARHAQARLSRSRKVLLGPVGEIYDLRNSFRRVNRRYFQGRLPRPTLSWSPTRSRRQLGYHDAHLNLIVISRWLDRKSVPVYVLDFIMYHELLHTVTPSEERNGKRIVHTREFKKQEQKFDHYEEAVRWLDRRRDLNRRKPGSLLPRPRKRPGSG